MIPAVCIVKCLFISWLRGWTWGLLYLPCRYSSNVLFDNNFSRSCATSTWTVPPSQVLRSQNFKAVCRTLVYKQSVRILVWNTSGAVTWGFSIPPASRSLIQLICFFFPGVMKKKMKSQFSFFFKLNNGFLSVFWCALTKEERSKFLHREKDRPSYESESHRKCNSVSYEI